MKPIVVVCGPTASGKSKLALQIAKHLQCGLISADSRQIYREMLIGTARPSIEEMQAVKHHLVGHVSIHEAYSADRFVQEAELAIAEEHELHGIALVSGGTAFYLDALLHGLDDLPAPDAKIRSELEAVFEQDGLERLQGMLLARDPDLYERIDRANSRRLIRAIEVFEISGKPMSSFFGGTGAREQRHIIRIAPQFERAVLYRRINKRVDQMITSGLLEEARQLFEFKHLKALDTVGYKELFSHFEGDCSLEEAVELIKRNSRRYAKRQLTWLRKDDSIHWIAEGNFDEAIELIPTK